MKNYKSSCKNGDILQNTPPKKHRTPTWWKGRSIHHYEQFTPLFKPPRCHNQAKNKPMHNQEVLDMSQP